MTDIDTLISSKTSSLVANLRGDSRLIALRDYLQAYADLASLELRYPDHMVDRLFYQSERLADKAQGILKWEPDPYSYNMNNPTDRAKYEKDMATLAKKKVMEVNFTRAYDRAGKIDAIESLVHLAHVSGPLLPELFGFPMMHEPSIAYTNEVLDKLAGGK